MQWVNCPRIADAQWQWPDTQNLLNGIRPQG